VRMLDVPQPFFCHHFDQNVPVHYEAFLYFFFPPLFRFLPSSIGGPLIWPTFFSSFSVPSFGLDLCVLFARESPPVYDLKPGPIRCLPQNDSILPPPASLPTSCLLAPFLDIQLARLKRVVLMIQLFLPPPESRSSFQLIKLGWTEIGPSPRYLTKAVTSSYPTKNGFRCPSTF